ncbi:polysaccharide pyruvyl transferase family protein [Rhodococcus sp. NPDC059968]|uniref:polysaccharide pyruvyl transferase family protein n=1 Tax=Rhodococcus sp. NPDC059968 TaxID=3347017 RepID=UPI00366C141C
MKILVLHGYSALNRGDGLLVSSTLSILREAFGEEIKVTLVASDPDSFSNLELESYPAVPHISGYSREYIRVLRNIGKFDLVVGVGGGYLRGGRVVELAKTSLVHGVQLFAAGRSGVPTVYFPQSVGPFRFGSRLPMARLLRRIDRVYGRDDRSMDEFNDVPMVRIPDLAILSKHEPSFSNDLRDGTPVLSVRAVNGRVPPLVRELAGYLETFDGYIQSETRGNDDSAAMSALLPRTVLTRNELFDTRTPRVVIAVRLHASLMALQAGHYVIHLAYERKGFGAFEDLGLPEYVHNVNKFEPHRVLMQAHQLATDEGVRREYARRVGAARSTSQRHRKSLIGELRGLAASGEN